MEVLTYTLYLFNVNEEKSTVEKVTISEGKD
jgi:hypothetical protein